MHGTGTECLTESSPTDAMHVRNVQHEGPGQNSQEKRESKRSCRERGSLPFLFYLINCILWKEQKQKQKKNYEIAFESGYQDNRWRRASCVTGKGALPLHHVSTDISETQRGPPPNASTSPGQPPCAPPPHLRVCVYVWVGLYWCVCAQSRRTPLRHSIGFLYRFIIYSFVIL